MQPAASPPVTLTYGSSLVWDRVKPGTTRGSIAYLGNFRQLDECKQKCLLLGALGYRFEDRAYNTHGKSEKEAKGSGELGLRAWMGLHFKLPEAELRRIYAERELAAVYTAAEREAFIAKYRES